VSRYQKGKTNLDFTEAGDSEWQWHQLGRMQVCTSLQTDNHASTTPLSFYRPDAPPAAQPTASKHCYQNTDTKFLMVSIVSGASWASSQRMNVRVLSTAQRTELIGFRFVTVMSCWCGYLSGARCRLFAYGPADATAIPKHHHLLPHLNPDWLHLSVTSLPRLSWKRIC